MEESKADKIESEPPKGPSEPYDERMKKDRSSYNAEWENFLCFKFSKNGKQYSFSFKLFSLNFYALFFKYWSKETGKKRDYNRKLHFLMQKSWGNNVGVL